jgi:nitric oxide reductase NorQ protein
VWFADDITAAPANVLARTYPALDGRGRLTVKEHLGETVTASDGFYAVCAYNPDLPGCEFPAPLRSRFQVAVAVPTDYDTVTRLCQ